MGSEGGETGFLGRSVECLGRRVKVKSYAKPTVQAVIAIETRECWPGIDA